MPFRELHDRYLGLVLKERINPEISFDYEALERFRTDEFRRIGDQLLSAGLTVTFHAPFMDLRPGAIDPIIRQVSLDRIHRVFDLIPYFRPRSIVCHPSFDERYYVSTVELWLHNSIETWQFFIKLAEDADTTISLENVYERDPGPLSRLIDACKSPRLRFCFDTGHFNVFSRTTLEEWIEAMAPHIFHLHLHDNRGKADEHLAIGDGTFHFARLFTMLRERGIRPIMTLEAHSEETLWRSVNNLNTLELP
ncbi:MAG: sugar phosphate isomerase/epimerase [Syntrophales bacterium]|nr:sugar phosphate isomerase/epimerase [Syntrophales bacterium]